MINTVEELIKNLSSIHKCSFQSDKMTSQTDLPLYQFA